MKLIENLTQEQKESIYNFVVNYIKNNNKITVDKDKAYFRIDDILYTAHMSVFKNTELFSIVVLNFKLDTSLSVQSKDILNTDNIKYISNFITLSRVSNDTEVDDDTFSMVTNIFIDKGYERSKKILKIKNKL